MIRPIAIGLAPNLEFDDIKLACRTLLSGKIFSKSVKDFIKLEEKISSDYKCGKVYLLNSGRSALFLALQSLNLPKNSEVILQAFTCIAVPNAVIWAGLKPIFADINKTDLGISIGDLKRKINKNTKVIIVQHTFGIPSKVKEIIKIARDNNLFIIEDCAHCYGSIYQGKNLGTYGDFGILSFGRDKSISTVFGGALLVNNSALRDSVERKYRLLNVPSKVWSFKQILHSIIMVAVLPTYNVVIGKAVLYFLQKLRLLTLPVYDIEKKGLKPRDFPATLPVSLAVLALKQINKSDRFNKQRIRFVEQYNRLFATNTIKTGVYPLLRYPLLVEKRDEILKQARRNNIYLGNWYSRIIDPTGVDLKIINYQKCTNAEYISQYIINLPVYPTLKDRDFQIVLSFLKNNLSNGFNN